MQSMLLRPIATTITYHNYGKAVAKAGLLIYCIVVIASLWSWVISLGPFV